MKYYETHYEEYLHAIEQYNLHPELNAIKTPKQKTNFGNMIFYGPSGVGKYSQVLSFLKKYSPSELKYDKKMVLQSEKQNYIYRISDIHYEIDMALLGCNSKIIWHDVFLQIVDIISVKTEKIGIIVCKNFHAIHNELLEIFYSYMQQYNHPQLNLHIKFILITEHISFLPNSILNNCYIVNVKRPSKDEYIQINDKIDNSTVRHSTTSDSTAIQTYQTKISNPKARLSTNQLHNIKTFMKNNVEISGLLNIKEIKSFAINLPETDIPRDNFNTICDSIIEKMVHVNEFSITDFRDTLYDILIYNLDAIECLWYIIYHFTSSKHINSNKLTLILEKTYSFLKYYNNNYRPIYHLESIFFFIINQIHNFKCQTKK
jgi:hypothetical protein